MDPNRGLEQRLLLVQARSGPSHSSWWERYIAREITSFMISLVPP